MFVSVLGTSSLIFAEATETQSLRDWIGSHIRMFKFYRGVPKYLVPDNLKSAVIKAHRTNPFLNRTYLDMAKHYRTIVLPARVRHPKDKAKAEKGVQHTGQRVLAPLRNRTFLSLPEANEAIAELLEDVNSEVSKALGGSRLELFWKYDQPSLIALPSEPFEFGEWKQMRVPRNYHLNIENHQYSVPDELMNEKVDVRTTEKTIEVCHKSNRVASHVRTPGARKPTTTYAHMPANHRYVKKWTPDYIHRKSKQIGPQTEKLIGSLQKASKGFELFCTQCLGILELHKLYGTDRIEAACRHALAVGTISYGSSENILQTGLECKQKEKTAEAPAIHHSNIRGPNTYK